MKQLLSILIIIGLLGFASLVFAEDQAQPAPPAAPTAATEQAQVAPAPAPVPKPDPSGANTGGAADVVGASAGAPTADDLKNLGPKEPLAAKLADVIGHNRIAINVAWTLVCGFLVMFMQAGFALQRQVLPGPRTQGTPWR